MAMKSWRIADNTGTARVPRKPSAELATETTRSDGGRNVIVSPHLRKTGLSPNHRPATIDDITIVIRALKGAGVEVEPDPPIVRTVITAVSMDDKIARAAATGIGIGTGPTANHIDENRTPGRQHLLSNIQRVLRLLPTPPRR